MLEASTTKSLVLPSAFIADSSAGGGAINLRSSRLSQPPALVTRVERVPSALKNSFLTKYRLQCMTGELKSHRDLLMQTDFLEVFQFVFHDDRADM